MRSLSTYRLSVFFVAFAGAMTLAPPERSLLPPFLFLGLSLPLWWLRNRARVLPAKSPTQRHLLFAVVTGTALVLPLVESSLLAAALHFTVILQAVLFFNAARPSHYALVYFTALAQLVVSAFRPVSPFQMLVFLYFASAAVFSLTLHDFMAGIRARLRSMEKPDPARDPMGAKLASLQGINRVFFLSLAIAAVVILVAIPLFLLLPRTFEAAPPPPPDGAEEDPPRAKESEASTALRPGNALDAADAGGALGPGGEGLEHFGFSGTIDLANWGAAFSSEREVLAMTTSQGGLEVFLDPGDLYLRGVVLDRFDGFSWTTSLGRLRRQDDGDDGRRDGWVRFEAFVPSDPRILRQEITARREFGPVRFYVRDAVAFEGNRVFLDPEGALWARPDFSFAPAELEVYAVRSIPFRLTPGLRRRLETSACTSPHPRYLAIPESAQAAATLARQLARPFDAPWTNARLFVDHLRKRCRYTTEPHAPPRGIDPLDEFLFRRRAGHCELFASALAVMLRSRGIPSRLVGGFHGGAFRTFRGRRYIAVRESDAHAWVEAWFDDVGWVRLDPTPATAGSAEDAEDGVEPLFDEGKKDVYGFILDYDRRSQKRLLGRMASGSWSVAGGVAGAVPWPLWGLALVAAGLLTWVVLQRKRKRTDVMRLLGRRLDRDPTRSLLFYAEMLKALRKLGFRKTPAQTPAEFARAVVASDGSLGEVDIVTEIFHRVRYREETPPRADLKKAFAVVQRLRNRSRAETASDTDLRKEGG